MKTNQMTVQINQSKLLQDLAAATSPLNKPQTKGYKSYRQEEPAAAATSNFSYRSKILDVEYHQIKLIRFSLTSEISRSINKLILRVEDLALAFVSF